MMPTHKVSRDELFAHLTEQLAFISASSAAFDLGFEGEAKRLATAIRILVHDTGSSKSLLTQLGFKKSLRYTDTADPINPRNLAPTLGLVMLKMTTGPGGVGEYVAPLGDLSPPRVNPKKQFDDWWTRPVTKDGNAVFFSRKDYVLNVSNKEGGAHIDPSLPTAYAALTKQNSLGWTYVLDSADDNKPFERNPALASVRQIAYELEQSLSEYK